MTKGASEDHVETVRLYRESKYKQEFVDEAIPFLSQGYSLQAFAAHLGVSREAVYLWKEKHVDFCEAVEAGQAAAALFWEGALIENAVHGTGNATSCIFGVKNRSQHEWREKQEVDHTSGGEKMPNTIILTAPKPKTEEDGSGSAG